MDKIVLSKIGHWDHVYLKFFPENFLSQNSVFIILNVIIYSLKKNKADKFKIINTEIEAMKFVSRSYLWLWQCMDNIYRAGTL